MQVQPTYNYCPYSPLATASVGADSNISSPDSVHAEYAPFAHHHYQQQQQDHEPMDVYSPHQHVHYQPQQQNYGDQYYGQESDSYDSDSTNGSYVSDQQRYWHQPQQQQQQQQTIFGYTGYSSQPFANFEQQQQQQQHQMYAQAQPSTSQQPPHQVYPEPHPYVDPAASCAPNQQQQPIASKQRAAASGAKTKGGRRKRKTAPESDEAANAPKRSWTSATYGGVKGLHYRMTASMRERLRTHELNYAFQQLRQVIAYRPSDKLSKIQTVRLATKYIKFLCRMLQFNASPEAGRHAYANPSTEVLASALESMSITANPVPLQDRLSYAFNVWRMDNEVSGTPRAE